MIEVYDREGNSYGEVASRREAKAPINELVQYQGLCSWNLFTRTIKEDPSEIFWARLEKQVAAYRLAFGKF